MEHSELVRLEARVTTIQKRVAEMERRLAVPNRALCELEARLTRLGCQAPLGDSAPLKTIDRELLLKLRIGALESQMTELEFRALLRSFAFPIF